MAPTGDIDLCDADGNPLALPTVEDGEEAEGTPYQEPNFAELLGPDCVIKRVDKDKNVVGGSNAKDMQRELMTRAAAQKRLGACAEHVKSMTRTQKTEWALDLKDRANEFYAASSFEEAAKLYNDCLVALDLDGTEEENEVVRRSLQLPVCTNLSACMIEMGQYLRSIEMSNIALEVDPKSWKALYRRGLANYRLGGHTTARPDFEAAAACIKERREANSVEEAEEKSMQDIERRLFVYMGHIRRFKINERASAKKMFEHQADGIYADRPDPKVEEEVEPVGPIDDSDEAIEAALERIRGDWACCRCRRRKTAKTD